MTDSQRRQLKGALLQCAKENENKVIPLEKFGKHGTVRVYTQSYVERLEEENAELKKEKEDLIFSRNQRAKCMCEDKEKLAKAKEIINELLMNGYDESTREKALNFLYPDKE